MPSGESYLVIGGCGFLGRHIVEKLIARGETNISVFDIVQRHFDSNVNFYIGDLSKVEDVQNAIRKSGATAVFHTASPAHGASERIYNLVNVTGTAVLLEACDGSTVKKLVYTSSSGVIYNGEHDNVNVDERLEYPEKPLDSYNATKVEAEKMVIKANSPELMTCALRPSGIFGPGDRQMLQAFHQVIKNNQTKMQIGYNNNLSDFTYVENVAQAHLLAMDKLGSIYPYSNFRSPISSITLTTGLQRIPTSDAHPLGPNTSPSEIDKLHNKNFLSNEVEESDHRPVLRNRMDQFSNQSNMDEEEDDNEAGMHIAGEVFIITNGEPVYFWDFARTVWKQLGHSPPYIISIPVTIGLILATLAEIFSKLMGKEPGFTKFRVSQATQQRYYDIEKARRLLGYEPLVGMDEGVKRWTAWYQEELAKQNQDVSETDKTK